MSKSSSKIELVHGDIISLAKGNNFGLIAHVIDCYGKRIPGSLAYRMDSAFKMDQLPLRDVEMYGSYNKLGQIEWKSVSEYGDPFFAANMYAIYQDKNNGPYGCRLDYDALRLCLRKLNYEFKDAELGIPRIGAGAAGGDWDVIEQIIKDELIHMKKITIVEKVNRGSEDDESLHATHFDLMTARNHLL